MVLELHFDEEEAQEDARCTERKRKEGESIEKASRSGVSLGFANRKNK